MASTIQFDFPERDGEPPCTVTWYDGVQNKPPRPKELKEGRNVPRNGKVIYGEDYTFMGTSHGSPLRIIPEEKMKEVGKDLPKVPSGSDHYKNFVLAVKGEAVEAHLDPGPYKPRQNKIRRQRLLREFQRREGDPNVGGSARKGRVITAYRQDAMRCAAHLAAEGPSKGAHVAKATGVIRATRMMADDHYGWFERVETGIYALTPKGVAAIKSNF